MTKDDERRSRPITRTDSGEGLYTPVGVMALGMADLSAGRSATHFVEEMERNGQREVVASQQLPTEIRGLRLSPEQRKGLSFEAAERRETEFNEQLLVQWGFELGPPSQSDPLFRTAKLPPGWSRKGADHAMWSYILDELGRERCAIFYKAAFYDRKAHLGITPRFRATTQSDDMDKPLKERVFYGVAFDADVEIYRSKGYVWSDGGPDTSGYEISRDDAARWLDENREGWTDLVAAWEMP